MEKMRDESVARKELEVKSKSNWILHQAEGPEIVSVIFTAKTGRQME